MAWTRGQNVYLIADSAVTKDAPLASRRSHFGELHEDRPGRTVEESALKIFRQEQTAVGFAGDAGLALDIFKTYVTFFAKYDAKEAFERAWSSNTPFKDRVCCALLAFHDGTSPRLVQFSADATIEPSDGCAVIGAVNDAESSLVKKTLLTLPSEYDKPKEVLCLCIASLQRFSIFDNFMERGIGGHYAGLSIGVGGLNWMPPAMHVIFDGSGLGTGEPEIPSVVIVFSSNDMVLVLNDLEVGWAVFLNSSGENSYLSPSEMRLKAETVATQHPIGHLPYRHIAIYNAKTSIVTVLLVDGLVPSTDVHPRFVTINGKSIFALDFSSDLLEVLGRDPQTGTIAVHDCRTELQ